MTPFRLASALLLSNQDTGHGWILLADDAHCLRHPFIPEMFEMAIPNRTSNHAKLPRDFLSRQKNILAG
jgi:hypothetical protein